MLSIRLCGPYQQSPSLAVVDPSTTDLLPRPSLSMGGTLSPQSQLRPDATVAQALEVARESAEGASDPAVNSILEDALALIWTKVQAGPDSYVMSRDEFAVFNYFQNRFVGNKMAVTARKRYWDNMRA